MTGLFNHLYYYPEEQLSSAGWFTRVTCHYNQETREGHLTSNKFLLGGQVEQEHKSWNTVCFRVGDEQVPRDQFKTWLTTQKAGVKLLAHRRQHSRYKPNYQCVNAQKLDLRFL